RVCGRKRRWQTGWPARRVQPESPTGGKEGLSVVPTTRPLLLWRTTREKEEPIARAGSLRVPEGWELDRAALKWDFRRAWGRLRWHENDFPVVSPSFPPRSPYRSTESGSSEQNVPS